MTRKIIWRGLVGVACLTAIALWVLSAPRGLNAEALAELDAQTGDAARGERIFLIGGCAACHAAADAKDAARLVLEGGRRFPTEFGTFVAPNISPDPVMGIGGWTRADFANAMLRGISPGGEHYFPAFPYTSYQRMRPGDIADLWAYLRTLPKSPRASEAHEVGFPFSVRRTLGLWKRLYRDRAPAEIARIATDTPQIVRGRYLVEGPGHCGECHTPRSMLGGTDFSRWLGGAPNPDGKGKIPNITPAGKLISSWSAEDIAYYLESGFTPEFDTAGGTMVDVIANTSRLPAEDRAAIAAYLKAIPAVSK